MNKEAILEGILFIKGEDGVTLNELIEVLDIKEEEVVSLLSSLEANLLSENRGLKLDILGNKYKLTTKVIHKPYYEKLIEATNNTLSQSSLETLAIIAYNAPITRSQVDDIRGVDSSHMVRKLVRLNLIKELGRSDLPGRPILYSTTDNFLDYFGLSTIDELPIVKEVKLDDSEINLFESKYKELDKVA